MTPNQILGAYLVIQKGTVGKRVELWKESTTIGRSLDCDIFLEDITVHRKQASILYTPTGYVLRDDHGSGDSFVNGIPVKEQLLSNADQLRFGNTSLTFFSNEGTRPFQLSSSRGRELQIGKTPVPQDTPVARLDFIQAHGNPRSIEIVAEVTIGRSRECDIFLEDLAVSRLHATIRELPDGNYELVANRSTTGTFINGRPMVRCLLHDGDVVQIGASKFTFRLSCA